MPHMPPLLSAKDISYSVDGKSLLSGITFDARDHRIGIVGRNGSGKTTLARIIAGLVLPTHGKVRIGGVDVGKDRKAALGHVGILFQNPDHQIIFPTVEEEIAFGLRQMGLVAAEVNQGVADILRRFDKSHWTGAAIHQLSQGQRQLVCLMSVLAMSPAVIILDEPFAGLDIPTTRQLSRYLDAVEASLVMITHDPAQLAHYNRVLWLDRGEVRRDGAPSDVLAAFKARMLEIGDGDDLSDLAG